MLEKIKKFFKNDKSFIKVTTISVEGNKILYEFQTSQEMDKYFIKKNMNLEIINKPDIDLNSIPESILIIPLFVNLLPVVWMSNSTLIINKLDKTLFDALDNIKRGYQEMYPLASFDGNIDVKFIEENKYDYENKYLSLFTYGVDSLHALINHLDENPILTTMWGADVPIESPHSWVNVDKNISKFAKDHNLDNVFIKSDFRRFMNTDLLMEEFGDVLYNNGNWWYTIQHGIALIGQNAILAYLFKVETIIIGGTFSYHINELFNLKVMRCASSPNIDNQFTFANCNVIHYGYDSTRADKLKQIVSFSKENNDKFNLHVCWHSSEGVNCNICEKCARTLLYLMSIGEDPNNYGFNVTEESLKQIKIDFKKAVYGRENIGGWSLRSTAFARWLPIQNNMRKNVDYWKDSPIGWLLDVDLYQLIEDYK